MDGEEIKPVWSAMARDEFRVDDKEEAMAKIFSRLIDKVEEISIECDQLKDDVETLRLQLAACGVAAMGNTEDCVKLRITKDNRFYSASYSDVCAAVDREISLRAERDQLKAENEQLRSVLNNSITELEYDVTNGSLVLKSMKQALEAKDGKQI